MRFFLRTGKQGFYDFRGKSNSRSGKDHKGDYTPDTVAINWPSPSSSANMMGAGVFDFGIEFGSGGIGKRKGDISAVTFFIESDATLTLGDDFGMRIRSVGAGREGSRKMIGSRGTETPNPVPEPGTMALLAIGLLGTAAVGRRKLQS